MGRPRTRSFSTAHAISNHGTQANASPFDTLPLSTLIGTNDWNFPPSVWDESPLFSSEGQSLQNLQPPIAEMENPLLSQALEPLK